MQMGFNYGFVSGHEKISSSYSDEIMHDTKSAYQMDVTKTVDVECSAQNGSNGVGLWQWVVTSNNQQS